MTALSWFFGGKKKEDKPVPVTVEVGEVSGEDGFTVVQSVSNQPGIYPQVPPSMYPTSNFYTPLPYTTVPQPAARPITQNQLEGVPFVLASALQQSSSQSQVQGLEDLRRAVFQIAADINDPEFQYDFKMEQSIMREASAYNNGS